MSVRRRILLGEFGGCRAAPRAKPLDIWLGDRRLPRSVGSGGWATAGWAASSPRDESRSGREQIQQCAAVAGREIEADHFGIDLAVSDGELPDELPRRSGVAGPTVDPRADLGRLVTPSSISSTATSRRD